MKLQLKPSGMVTLNLFPLKQGSIYIHLPGFAGLFSCSFSLIAELAAVWR